jgi:cardiolipin synthase
MHWSVVYLISEWVIRLTMLFYVPQRRPPSAARTWLLFIFLMPWPGVILYALIGRVYVPKRRIEQQVQASRSIRAAQEQMGARECARPDLPPHFAPVGNLAARLGDFEPFSCNRIELLDGNEIPINRLVADIESAADHVHLLYYIFENDATGRRVADALSRATRRGVKCRVLMDAVGSKRGIKHLAPALRNAGVEVIVVLPVGIFRRKAARFDLRNHRKIAVVDGSIGYAGSQNIVDGHFVSGYPNEELVVRVTGPVVAQLQAVFLADYYFETDVELRAPTFFPELDPCGSTVAQVVPSGPGYQRNNGEELMVSAIYAAAKSVVLTTPYFVPDEPFLQALRSAARRGVSVHLVVSMHANQLITQLAQRSYYDELLNDGVAIHLYRPRFLHAKHLTVDDDIGFVGSSNIDIRSFALNSEIGLLICDPEVVRQLRAIQDRYLQNSHTLTLEEWRKRRPSARMAQSIARLADSLL